MKEIPLSQGKVALVDDADYAWLSQWKWCLVSGKYAGRAVRCVKGTRRQKFIFMHCLIVGKPDGSAIDVDHADRNMLNNQRANLRRCTERQNAKNRRKPGRNKFGHTPTSQYKGVHWRKARNRWEVLIMSNGKQRYIGRFPRDQELEAARAYDQAAIRLHGEFACLNFPYNPVERTL